MSKSKHVLFPVAAVLLSLSVMTALFAGVEVYLHRRYEMNMWGYRGPVARRKLPGEKRIAVLGESTAWGYGVKWAESFPTYLERKLNEVRPREGQGPVSVLNLAYNNEGAYSFRYTLRDYEYLNFDVVLFYTGYNDLGGNTSVFRHESPVFKLTGYLPLLPSIFIEKASALRHGRYGDKTVFKPNLARRATAAALEAAAEISQSLERQVGRLSNVSQVEPARTPAECGEPWTHYCKAIRAAVDYALSRGNRVVVVTQPYISDRHVDQQRVIVGMLRERFADHPHLTSVNLGRVVDLRDSTLAYDGMHLTASGNERIAESLVPPLLKVLE